MKILVLGASGLLAKPVIEHFDEKGYQLRLFSRNVKANMFQKDYEIVNGDVLSQNDLEKAAEGCDAFHVTISNVDEEKAAEIITNVAKKKGIKIISFVSGCTVREENRWFPMIDKKFRAEQIIINSGIDYFIFRPTWFFESLDLMIRNGKASIIGKQPIPFHWVAAADFARMIEEAFSNQKARNKAFYILGPEPYRMKDLLEKYCITTYPEIKKVSVVPFGMIKFIAFLKRSKMLKNVAELFAYFEKTGENCDPEETNKLLGKPEITFEKWLELRG